MFYSFYGAVCFYFSYVLLCVWYWRLNTRCSVFFGDIFNAYVMFLCIFPRRLSNLTWGTVSCYYQMAICITRVALAVPFGHIWRDGILMAAPRGISRKVIRLIPSTVSASLSLPAAIMKLSCGLFMQCFSIN